MRLDIRGRRVGAGEALFVIAELGLNHGGDTSRALALVAAAARAGASAVKLQTLRADRLVAAHCPPPAHVGAGSLRDVFRTFELDEAAHRAIAERAHAKGLAFLSTPFYLEAVDLLESVGCDAYKIASGDLTHHALIDRVARTGKPIILSTGMSELEEIEAALACARGAGAAEVALLHCVSAYPVPAGDENLRAVRHLAEVFGVPVGLSDHGTCWAAPAVALALGASIYERHFVLAAGGGEIDADVSSTPAQLREIVTTAERVRMALGDGRKTCRPSEAANRDGSRRGLYATRPLAKGDLVRGEDVVALRPAGGLAAARLRDLVGQRVTRAIGEGEAFMDSDLPRQRPQEGCR